MERENLKRSDEEADTLARSTKKFKDSHQATNDMEDNLHYKAGSYRDKLVGSIPGAFEKAFGFACDMQEDLQSDDEEEQAEEGCLRVCFSRDEKSIMRAPWHQALIIKPFGRKVGYTFLAAKIRSMWNPRGGMDCIDLGFDFYLIKFENREDVDNVLKGGPWFIGQHFLAIRQWEPEFHASTATLSSVAVWIRLPELPIEFYEYNALMKIGKAIGPVLRIDANTANGVRGRFARLCVQVNLDKPLPKSIFLGRLKQSIMYEGIGTLCFECGRIGHGREVCPLLVRGQSRGVQEEHGSGSQEVQSGVAATPVVEEAAARQQDEYGEWMIVTRRKSHNKTRDKQSGASGSQTDDKTVHRAEDNDRAAGKRKAPVLQGDRPHREEFTSSPSHHNKTFDRKSSARNSSRVSSKQKTKVTVGSQASEMGLSKEKELFVFGANAGPLSDDRPAQRPCNSSIAAKVTKTGLADKERESNTLKIKNHGESRELGVVLQGKNYSDRRRDDQVDKAGSNGGVGMVRFGVDAGLEKHVSVDGGEQIVRLSSCDEQSMGADTESMVEVCHGPTSIPNPTTSELKLASDRIKCATLGKIADRGGEQMDEKFDCCEEESTGQTCGMLVEGERSHDEDVSTDRSKDLRHHPHQILSRGEGDNSSFGHLVPRLVAEQGGGDGCMEVEGH